MIFSILLVTFSALCASLVLPSMVYFLRMRHNAKLPWGLRKNEEYRPRVTLIVATYNEASVIKEKLEHIQKLDYPEDKLKVLVVDSNSTDGTLDVCKAVLSDTTFRFPVQLVSENERHGKSHALNTALNYADGELIATSDADSLWKEDVLLKTVPFFADPSIGAVTGREELLNREKSVHTMSEGLYRNLYYTLRLGESKINSTLIFQGELSIYRRSAFKRFEDRPGHADDTGTIVGLVSRGYRCIFVPDATFYDRAAYSLSGRLMLKSRRAQHLTAGLIQSLRLKIAGKLNLPWSNVFFNIYFHILSPLIALAALIFAVLILVLYFQFFWFVPLIFFIAFLFKKARLFGLSYLTGNIALIVGLANHAIRGRKTIYWRKINEMRKQ